MVHTRDANQDTFDILENHCEVPVLLHGYAGTAEETQHTMDLGYYISIPSSVTIRKPYQIVTEHANLNQIMLETDTPYHLPFRPKGKRWFKNTPAGVIEGCAKIAELKDSTFADVAQATTSNTKTFFKIA